MFSYQSLQTGKIQYNRRSLLQKLNQQREIARSSGAGRRIRELLIFPAFIKGNVYFRDSLNLHEVSFPDHKRNTQYRMQDKYTAMA